MSANDDKTPPSMEDQKRDDRQTATTISNVLGLQVMFWGYYPNKGDDTVYSEVFLNPTHPSALVFRKDNQGIIETLREQMTENVSAFTQQFLMPKNVGTFSVLFLASDQKSECKWVDGIDDIISGDVNAQSKWNEIKVWFQKKFLDLIPTNTRIPEPKIPGKVI